MLNKIKALFGFGSSTPAPVEAPYKVELAPIVETMVSPQVEVPMPIGIEAIVATPVAEAKPKAPAKPKAEKPPKVVAIKVPAVKKPRIPKAT